MLPLLSRRSFISSALAAIFSPALLAAAPVQYTKRSICPAAFTIPFKGKIPNKTIIGEPVMIRTVTISLKEFCKLRGLKYPYSGPGEINEKVQL